MFPNAIKPARKLTRAEWNKTPYATSDVRDPDKAIRDLLARYGVRHLSPTETESDAGRFLYVLRFRIGETNYRIDREALHADAPRDALVRQVKRAVYHWLKATLEDAVVWGPLERVLLHAIEGRDGKTVYDAAAPMMKSLQAGTAFAQLPAAPTLQVNPPGAE